MKDDLDRLMTRRGLEAIVILGPDGLAAANGPWNYIVGGQHLNGLVVKQRGAPARLIYNAMERQQAEATELELVPVSTWNMREISAQYPGRLASTSEWYRRMFRDLDIRGRVGFYGTVEASWLLALAGALRETAPEI